MKIYSTRGFSFHSLTAPSAGPAQQSSSLLSECIQLYMTPFPLGNKRCICLKKYLKPALQVMKYKETLPHSSILVNEVPFLAIYINSASWISNFEINIGFQL